MQIFHHIDSIRSALADDRKAGKRIGFVPTMGNLHSGHLALMTQAKASCDVLVVSIFVNRLQFGLNEDWDKYPRTWDEDKAKLLEIGCDFLFYPEEQEIYPNGMAEQTRVVVPTMTDVLCGASRPGHFEGVTTVVSKLFNIVQPDEAVFGIKDFQQLAIIRRMVEDLCIPVKITAGEIFRESDGLAMSSRNGYLSAEERPQANQLYLTLKWLCSEIEAGRRDYSNLEREAGARIESFGFKPDYISIANSHSLQSAVDDDKDLTVLGAIYTNNARLIDNLSMTLN